MAYGSAVSCTSKYRTPSLPFLCDLPKWCLEILCVTDFFLIQPNLLVITSAMFLRDGYYETCMSFPETQSQVHLTCCLGHFFGGSVNSLTLVRVQLWKISISAAPTSFNSPSNNSFFTLWIQDTRISTSKRYIIRRATEKSSSIAYVCWLSRSPTSCSTGEELRAPQSEGDPKLFCSITSWPV